MRNSWSAPIRANNETALTALIGESHEILSGTFKWVCYELQPSAPFQPRRRKQRLCPGEVMNVMPVKSPQRGKRVGDPRKKHFGRAASEPRRYPLSLFFVGKVKL